MITSFFDTYDEYAAALAHSSDLSTTASLTYHRASIAPTRDPAPAEPAAAKIMAYIDRHITQPALSYAADN